MAIEPDVNIGDEKPMLRLTCLVGLEERKWKDVLMRLSWYFCHMCFILMEFGERQIVINGLFVYD